MSNNFCNKTSKFLAGAGWDKYCVNPLAQDASARSYFRLTRDNSSAILMQAPTNTKSETCPDYADEKQRKQLGYAAEARLADNDCGAFVCIANQLTIRGFSAPHVLAADIKSGLILLEDLGKQSFFDILQNQPEQEEPIYKAATSMLAALTRCSFSKEFIYQNQKWPVLPYDKQALLAETDLLIKWYLPFLGIDLSKQQAAQLQGAWGKVLDPVMQTAPVLVLRDFHAQNLIWMQKREGVANIGLLDFQDAVFGHAAYDLVSLLQDARRDVTASLEQPMISRFIIAAKISDPEGFRTAYHILGAQRAAKILGIFVRLAKRDGKQHYLDLLPRVERHFIQNLKNPVLQPIAEILKPVLDNINSRLVDE